MRFYVPQQKYPMVSVLVAAPVIVMLVVLVFTTFKVLFACVVCSVATQVKVVVPVKAGIAVTTAVLGVAEVSATEPKAIFSPGVAVAAHVVVVPQLTALTDSITLALAPGSGKVVVIAAAGAVTANVFVFATVGGTTWKIFFVVVLVPMSKISGGLNAGAL